MEPLRLKPRQVAEDEIENWDDDEDLVLDGDELSFRSSFSGTNGPNSSRAVSRPPSRRRGSASSHMSFRSEIESLAGDEQQLHLPGDDEASTMDAIGAAERAGIPLPKNVPSSALIGGTIKRLGGRKVGRTPQEDWEQDLELPENQRDLQLKTQNSATFPETLRQISGGSIHSSPTRSTSSTSGALLSRNIQSRPSSTVALASAVNLDRFKDTDDDNDDDFLDDEAATIKLPKARALSRPIQFITPPTPQRQAEVKESEEDFEEDLELPSDGTLRLLVKKDIPKTPPTTIDDLDWGEGSLGTRYGGTRRDGRSNRSSSVSAMSPSISSSMTAESEDENLDGLVLPSGPFNFKERLQQRKKSFSPERIPEEALSPRSLPPAREPAQAEADRDDFFDDIEVGDGNVFGSGKLTLHRNIRLKEAQPASPARPKTSVSLTFTNKMVPSQTRASRLSRERAHSTSLEPVYESTGSDARWRNNRRPSQSRGGHSHQSSIVSLPNPTTSPGRQYSLPTPRTRSSFSSLKGEASTTNSQLLRQKRSLPAVRGGLGMQAKTAAHRPSSRTETGRPQSGSRPKTPVERQRSGLTDSPASLTRKPQPFLPAGVGQGRSQHVASKTSRQYRRHDSDNSIDIRPASQGLYRSLARSPSPQQRFRIASDTWERLSKPKNKKHFGDGHELDGFDDLPTSRESEARFLKQSTSGGTKAMVRNRLPHHILPERIATPAPPAPFSPIRSTPTPRFARDTAASRIARETSLAHRAPSHGPLATIAAQREGPLWPRSHVNVQTQQTHQPQSTIRPKKKTKRPLQLKPHLISNLGVGKESKVVNGMYYNAETFQWEGNDNDLNAFDAAVATPIAAAASTHFAREKDVATPRPALISNFSAPKGVQVVSGMVFDPQNMCWLDIESHRGKGSSHLSDTVDGFDAPGGDDEDIFKDISDLDDTPAEEERREGGRVSDVKDDWLVGEEFDVGPEFVRRHREEEDRWRRKCEKWLGRGPRDRELWRWTIRDLVSQFGDIPA